MAVFSAYRGEMRGELGYVAQSGLDLILMLDARTAGPLVRFLAAGAGLELGDP